MNAKPSAWSSKDECLQTAVDATSLAAFMRCPRLYYYSVVLGYEKNTGNDDLLFGLWYHAATEIFIVAVSHGAPKDSALRDALRHVLTVSHGWVGATIQKNRYTLARAIVGYADDAWHPNLVPWKTPQGTLAVEQSWALPLPAQAHTGEQFLLCGHMDGVVVDTQMSLFTHAVYEKKTTASTVNAKSFHKYKPAVQPYTYVLAARLLWPKLDIDGIVYSICQTAGSFARFMLQYIQVPRSLTDEWFDSLVRTVASVSHYARERVWPMNHNACHGFAGTCTFYKVCSRPPEDRLAWLAADFQQRERWDPLDPREPKIQPEGTVK